MSTKTDITALINANLASASNITATEHRAVLDSVLNSFYPTVLIESSSVVGTITAKNSVNTSLEYYVKIAKVGRMVFLSGYCINNSSSIVSTFLDDFFFEIINSEYFPTTLTALSPIYPIVGANYMQLGATGNKKIYINSVGAGQRKDFNIWYYTEN